uniref:Uncharacterized protein n=1 Tax=Rhizophora mucronata TaxID=61149 RepID=A0A2P2IK19_RHIMU
MLALSRDYDHNGAL